MLFYLTTALIYLAITLISSYFIAILERRFRRGQTRLA
jgi:ABC-type arginine transport system permease subunit